MRIITTLAIATLVCSNAMAQTTAQDKVEAAKAKATTAYENAKKKLESVNHKAFVTDSLIEVGQEQITDAEIQIKELNSAKKSAIKEFAEEKKNFNKYLKDKDKMVVKQAMADIKALDKQSADSIKAIDKAIANAEKMKAKGQANVTKGKNGQKAAAEAVKQAEAKYEVAAENYEKITGYTAEKINNDSSDDNSDKKAKKEKKDKKKKNKKNKDADDDESESED